MDQKQFKFDSSEALQEEIAKTRSDIDRKFQSLRYAVNSTVTDAKVSVQATYDEVKESISVSHQVRKHPWEMIGGAVGVGFALAQYLKNDGTSKTVSSPYRTGTALLEAVAIPLGLEMQKLRNNAIGATFGLLKHITIGSLPTSLQSPVERIIDSANDRLGGAPVASVNEFEVMGQNTPL